MAKDKGESFSSSAGLMRYFDSEDEKGLRVGPKAIVGVAVAFTILILVLPVLWPMSRWEPKGAETPRFSTRYAYALTLFSQRQL